jgi:hypothetical protein
MSKSIASLAQATAAGFTLEEIKYQLAHSNDNRGPSVITVTTIFIACALIAVTLRLVTRKAIVKLSWQADDYAILVALVGSCRENKDENH